MSETQTIGSGAFKRLSAAAMKPIIGFLLASVIALLGYIWNNSQADTKDTAGLIREHEKRLNILETRSHDEYETLRAQLNDLRHDMKLVLEQQRNHP